MMRTMPTGVQVMYRAVIAPAMYTRLSAPRPMAGTGRRLLRSWAERAAANTSTAGLARFSRGMGISSAPNTPSWPMKKLFSYRVPNITARYRSGFFSTNSS